MTSKLPTYYPRIANPMHPVRDWCKVRSMIRALRRGKALPIVWIDGKIKAGNLMSGTHRAAASEIRSLLDGTRPYDDLDVRSLNGLTMTEDEAADLIHLWEVDPEEATAELDRRSRIANV
jgi:hypothetical protein